MLTTDTSRTAPGACRHLASKGFAGEQQVWLWPTVSWTQITSSTITREETQPRLKSQCPFATSGKNLLSTALPSETKAHWIARMWPDEWRPSTSRLREYIVSPSKCCSRSDLPRQAWVKLNGLRTGVRRFNANMWRWGSIQESSLQLWSRPADSKSHHHRVPPLSSTKWSPWLD